MLNNPASVLPALRYGMNLQLMKGQPQMAMEAPFRILTTCSWEQNAYTVKIYVPLHGVKTDLLRAVFEPHMLDIKAMNLQVQSAIVVVCYTWVFCMIENDRRWPAGLTSLWRSVMDLNSGQVRCRAKTIYSV